MMSVQVRQPWRRGGEEPPVCGTADPPLVVGVGALLQVFKNIYGSVQEVGKMYRFSLIKPHQRLIAGKRSFANVFMGVDEKKDEHYAW